MQEQSLFRFSATSLAVGLALLAFNNEVWAQTDTCAEGYVWREAFPGDHVCVDPETRDLAADENRNAEKLRKKDGNGECEAGYAWRMAGPQDRVCVTQIERDQAQQDNNLASTRIASAIQARTPVLN